MQAIEDQTILVTGSTDGIGKHTARELAERGAHVLIHGRDRQKTECVTDELRSATKNSRIEYFLADFSSLDNVRDLAGQLNARKGSLDVLINNAGIGFGSDERQLSDEGYELRFTVNYLAPFLLTQMLLPTLQSAAPSRIVNVSSAGQHPIDFDNVMLEKQYSPQRAYAQSKLALVMFTFELADRLDNSTTVNTLHPGTLLDTKMVRKAGFAPRGSAEEGAEAVAWLATSEELTGVTGKYFDRKKESKASPQAYDAKARKKLWKLSNKLTNID